MTISIIGTGAIGGYYGLMLANAGHDVHFLLRSDYEYVLEHGLHLQSEAHQSIFIPEVNAYKNVANMPKSDIILVALKSTQNSEVLPQILREIADEKSIVVLCQNGLGLEADLSKKLPHLQIAAGVALIAAYKSKSGVIVHQAYGDLDLASYNVTDLSTLEEFSKNLAEAGVKSTVQELNLVRWKKLIWNMAFNGLSVVLNKTTTQILSEPQSFEQTKAIMKEVIQGARACGIHLPEAAADVMINFTQNMSPYYPSMKLDFDNGRPLEIKYMYQKPISAAREAGFEMKETEKLYQTLLSLI
ncbi:2-dehydropantoate 2-reductase [Chondrinema litorale]|uniref:2-dehydropantoate 2-reductase n=1 Tax=Chondrinema litorale TaxID=2994555 RepID=UPI002542731B|nr:2-dehydropantoate 2-reductase [Chondrinema litorale]UZR98361.1 2-dehydropantoate 2-reductase [Chondrinema litorale]